MRTTLLVLLLLVTSSATAQDSLRRVGSQPITVSGVASPVDSLPISTTTRRIEPTQTLTSNSLEQAVRAVPGVQIDNRNNYALGDRITMRGIGARSFFGTRGIRVIKNDIPLTFADGQTNLEIIDPSQLASVTVLHGPASSIFGNASGGTLLFKSLMPPSPGRLVRGAATLGSLGYQRFTGSIGSANGDLAYGAYITLDSLKGYRDWSGVNAVHFGTQAVYTFDEDALRFTFDNVSFSAQNPGALSKLLLDSNRRMAYAPNVRQKTGKEGHQLQAGLTWLDQMDANSLTSSVYAISRSITNPTPQQVVSLDRNLFGARISYHKPQDPGAALRHNANGIIDAPTYFDILEWSAILDAQYQFDDRMEHANDSGRKAALQTDQKESILNVGAGLNMKYPLLSELDLSAGLRYDLLNFKATDDLLTNGDQSGDVTMSAFSPSLGILYTGFEQVHFFANASMNFESPTSTELANQPNGDGGYNADLSPQSIKSLDFGWRVNFEEQLRFNLTFFLAQIEDALIPFQVPEQDGRDFYRNAGTISNRGIEFDLSLNLDRSTFNGLRERAFDMNLAYTYVRSVFTDYVLRDTIDLEGKQQPGVHPHLVSLDIAYHPFTGAEIGAALRHASSVAVNDANTFYSDEYTVVDVRAGYKLMINNVGEYQLGIEPFVQVQNVFDRPYVGSFAVNAFGNRYYEPSPGRMILAGLHVTL